MISVVMPTYNRGKLIENSIRSILNQTYTNIELIIVDDGSDDNTEDVIKCINDDRIRIIRGKHQGACHARNVGIKAAKGNYVAFQDSDDVWVANKLEIQMSAMEKSNSDIVFCKLKKIIKNKKIILWPANITEGIITKDESLLGIGTQTILCKTEIISELMFDEEMPRFQELEMLIRARQNGYKLYCVDQGLVNYVVGDDSISSDINKRICGYRLLLKKHPNIKSISSKMCETISNSLLITANEQKNNNDLSYKDTILLAHEYSMTTKLRIKEFLIKIGLYDYIKSSH